MDFEAYFPQKVSLKMLSWKNYNRFSYYSPALKKGGYIALKKGGYIGFGLSVIPFVCLFVCSFVIIFCFRSISSELFYRIYPNLVCALILT